MTKKTTLAIIIALFALLIGGCIQDQAYSTKVQNAATVNGEGITMQELDLRYSRLPMQYQSIITKENLLDQIINEVLLLQEAKKQGIEVTSQEAQEQIAQVMEKGGISEETFAENLKKQNLTKEEFSEIFKKQITITNLINKTVVSKIEVPQDDIKKYYDENKELFGAQDGQIRARHILVKTEDEAKEVKARLDKKEDFIDLARELSIDYGSAQIGGDLGFFEKERMVKEFGDAAFKLKVGEISPIVKTQFGYHIIKREDQTIPFEEAQDGIKMIILNQMQEEKIKTYIEELKGNAKIEILLPKEVSENKEGEQLKDGSETTSTTVATSVNVEELTFKETDNEICMQDGKPVIRLFSTTACPHCRWIKPTFDQTMLDLISQGKVVAYHWDLDTGDNTLTPEVEVGVPKEELALYKENNPQSTVPTFIFGCKYLRIGNGYEESQDLNKEKEEFLRVVELLE